MKPRDDIGFELDMAISCAKTYKGSTGVGCIIIDSYGRILYNGSGENTERLCSLCSNKSCHSNKGADIHNVYLYGSYQAERFGGKYTFFCPLGLTYWASPITTDGIMKGAILAGPVLMVEPEEFLLEDFIKSCSVDSKNIEKLIHCCKDVAIVSPEKVNSFSEMLFIIAAHISDVQPSQYYEDREYQEQQSSISDYIYNIKTMGGYDNAQQSYPLEKEKELLSLISMGDKAGAQSVLNIILGYIFFSTGRDFEVVKARILELIVLLSRAALEGGADVEQIFGLNYRYLSKIHSFKTVDELAFWLSRIMARFTDCVFNLSGVKHVDVIYQAVNYIKQSYMNQITLEEVASHVYLSPSYFSKVFKDEMKCNFSSYINKLRVENSKRLLSDTSLSLVEISDMVGFEGQSYYSKVFKKMTGVSPGRYRKSKGNILPGDKD